MSIKVKFDTILGRLRERDGDGSDPQPTPDPTPLFTVDTSPAADATFMADLGGKQTLIVTVTTRFNGVLVDADNTPARWTRSTVGTYTRNISQPGTIAAQAFSYTPGGQYGSQTVTKSSQARSLVKVWPAYWGLWPSPDASGDISEAVAAIAAQHRLTADLPLTTLEIPNPSADDCWLWIVTRGSAAATPEAFSVSMLRDPVPDKSFVSPLSDLVMLDGYKVYVSINPADAGLSFGNVRLSVNLS